MPPRNAVATMSNPNGKMAPKGPRAKKEEMKTEDTSVPTIKTQITNPTKASSGKSFLDALRSGQPKRPAPAAAAPAPPPEPTVSSALPETGASPPPITPAPAAVEPEPPVQTVVPVVETAAVRRDAVETAVMDEPAHNPVTLPDAGTGFSWAHDDDYTFVSEYTQPQPQEPQEPELPAAPQYHAQYPQEIVDAQPLVAGRMAFRAPAEHETLSHAVAALKKGHTELMESRRVFDEFCAQRRREFNEQDSQYAMMQRRLDEDRGILEQQRSQLLADQQMLAQSQTQAQAQLKQQQQQQQQSVSAAPPAMNVQAHPTHPQQSPQQSLPPPPPTHQQQPQPSVPGYTHSPNSLPWSMGQPEQWRDNISTTPPYNSQPFYQQNNNAYPMYRGKQPYVGGNGYGNGMMGRGAGAPQGIVRGNMRPNNHMPQGFNGRPMGNGPRGGNMENGGNGAYNPRQQPTGYMQPTPDMYNWKQ